MHMHVHMHMHMHMHMHSPMPMHNVYKRYSHCWSKRGPLPLPLCCRPTVQARCTLKMGSCCTLTVSLPCRHAARYQELVCQLVAQAALEDASAPIKLARAPVRRGCGRRLASSVYRPRLRWIKSPRCGEAPLQVHRRARPWTRRLAPRRLRRCRPRAISLHVPALGPQS